MKWSQEHQRGDPSATLYTGAAGVHSHTAQFIGVEIEMREVVTEIEMDEANMETALQRPRIQIKAQKVVDR